MKPKLERIRRIEQKAKESPREVYTSLFHHVYAEEMLTSSFRKLKKNAKPGIDGLTVSDYAENLQENLKGLQERLGRMGYRPKPSKRTYIPKVGSTKKRPLGIPCTEDKIVQMAVKRTLEPIYEEKFIEDSYGYRPGRHAHDAIDVIGRTIQQKKVSYIVEADIKGFFDHVNHDILLKLLEYRIKDKRMLRLIHRQLKAGIMEDGLIKASEEGSPQGSILSPLLSNIYLHYGLDKWFELIFAPNCRGEVYFYRYADDYIACFQYKSEALSYMEQMEARLNEFHLEIEPSKTKLIEFGRFAETNSRRRGGGKPDTFDFLGFTHYCSKTKYGQFKVARKTSRKKLNSKLKEFNLWLKKNRSKLGKRKVFKTSVKKLTGHLNYFAITDNYECCSTFEHRMKHLLYKWINRMSQRRSYNWNGFPKALEYYRWPKVRVKVKLSPFAGMKR
jgi:RNA-directed DNA polymerase